MTMPVLLRSTWLLFRMHFALVVRTRRALLCLLLVAIPPVLAWLVVHHAPRAQADHIGGFLAWLLVLQVIVPVVSLVAGSAVLTEEIESRTITYVFTRPIPRAALLFGRWLATLVLVSGLLGSSAWLTAHFAMQAPIAPERRDTSGASYNQPERHGEWAERHRAEEAERAKIEDRYGVEDRTKFLESMLQRFVWATILGGTVYSLLFAVLGVFLRHSMIFGLGYCFAFEGFMANFPGETQTLSIQYYLRSILVDDRLWIFHQLYPWGLEHFAEPLEATRVLGYLVVVALVVGGWSIGRRQYLLTA
jgi:hypothetical protein